MINSKKGKFKLKSKSSVFKDQNFMGIDGVVENFIYIMLTGNIRKSLYMLHMRVRGMAGIS